MRLEQTDRVGADAYHAAGHQGEPQNAERHREVLRRPLADAGGEQSPAPLTQAAVRA